MTDNYTDPDLNVGDLTTIIEEFTTIFIRLPSVEKLSFTTLSVLHTLSRKGPMRLTALTATEQMSQPAITQIVRRLEQDGLVERRADPGDARAVLIQLTPRGAQIIDVRRDARVRQLNSLLDRLSKEERKAIAAAVPALAHAIELGRKAELPLHPRPSSTVEQYTERPQEKE
ncbi:MarR family winged helix-turn-helix transcriptional regulator [Dictyobacter aurantiacus]|uniref:MarR family transcriptional regulator n=1 Tax=Dictyobacter aurantiacus TaxID=1936993 RepID=A0A401ZMY1_9CHLR|nr:MarR family transcriptional regulator [Dictyobacter aurantiacus]GCE08237.1 MarR family transcriptional regulator [Dictyobacter aurantiacus]